MIVPEKITNRETRFDFLDGYRGSLALFVVIAHAPKHSSCPFLQSFSLIVDRYSISGFFLLSSFLLTYRLLKDFHKPNSNIALSILQYSIRRFFRIYVVVTVFAIGAVHGPKIFAGDQYGRYNSVLTILTLGPTGLNNLWTIPITINGKKRIIYH